MDRYLRNNANFSKLDFDITETIMTKVDNWAKEWFLKGEINQTVVDFLCNVQAKPAKNYGLVKTHKPGQKLRVITAGTCSAVSNLSAFMERLIFRTTFTFSKAPSRRYNRFSKFNRTSQY